MVRRQTRVQKRNRRQQNKSRRNNRRQNKSLRRKRQSRRKLRGGSSYYYYITGNKLTDEDRNELALKEVEKYGNHYQYRAKQKLSEEALNIYKLIFHEKKTILVRNVT